MPKLSVITINLNDAPGLQKTIESVVSQTFDDYEYIIIDGGSSDGSVDVIKEFAHKITYWVSEPDKGIYNAMNKGILQASGEYLLFLNSGDWLVDKDVLSKVFAKGSEADILYGDIVFWEDFDKTKPFSFKNIAIDLNYLYKNSLAHPASFIKRSLFGLEQYDESYKLVSDWKFFLQKIVFENASLHYLDLCVSNFNTHGLTSDKKMQELLNEEMSDVLHRLFQPLILSNIEGYYTLKKKPLVKKVLELNNHRFFSSVVFRLIAILCWVQKTQCRFMTKSWLQSKMHH